MHTCSQQLSSWGDGQPPPPPPNTNSMSSSLKAPRWLLVERGQIMFGKRKMAFPFTYVCSAGGTPEKTFFLGSQSPRRCDFDGAAH